MKCLSISGKRFRFSLLMQERVTLKFAAFLFNKKFVILHHTHRHSLSGVELLCDWHTDMDNHPLRFFRANPELSVFLKPASWESSAEGPSRETRPHGFAPSCRILVLHSPQTRSCRLMAVVFSSTDMKKTVFRPTHDQNLLGPEPPALFLLWRQLRLKSTSTALGSGSRG